ncbi:MAG: hypothetical protein H6698_09530, partial [Myxococcales bacterium]|nr:hypothetical protein [Myxococcales bacterium]
MKSAIIAIAAVLALWAPSALVTGWVEQAGTRLAEREAAEAAGEAPPTSAVAAVSNEEYCTPQLKVILRRVLQSCGLAQGGGGERGCQPATAAQVAALSGGDFNALFLPMAERAGVVQFDASSA